MSRLLMSNFERHHQKEMVPGKGKVERVLSAYSLKN